jgi:hypothetical protein
MKKIYNGYMGGYIIDCIELNKTFECKKFGVKGINVPVRIKEIDIRQGEKRYYLIFDKSITRIFVKKNINNRQRKI